MLSHSSKLSLHKHVIPEVPYTPFIPQTWSCPLVALRHQQEQCSLWCRMFYRHGEISFMKLKMTDGAPVGSLWVWNKWVNLSLFLMQINEAWVNKALSLVHHLSLSEHFLVALVITAHQEQPTEPVWVTLTQRSPHHSQSLINVTNKFTLASNNHLFTYCLNPNPSRGLSVLFASPVSQSFPKVNRCISKNVKLLP